MRERTDRVLARRSTSRGRGRCEVKGILMDGQHIRHIILEQSKRADVGHIGCALSIADIVAALYTEWSSDRRAR